MAEELDASSFTLEQVLKNDGWRSVSVEDLKRLPPDQLVVLHGYLINGQMTYWLKDAPRRKPYLL